MPPQVKDQRTKARHPKPRPPQPPVQLVTFPAIPRPTKLAAAQKPHQIFNPNNAALSYNSPTPQLAGLNFNFPKGSILGGADLNPLDALPDFPDQSLLGGADPNPLHALSNPISSIADTIGWLIHPQRLIKIVGGGILILMGLHQLTKQLTGATPGKHAHKLGESLMTAATLIPK